MTNLAFIDTETTSLRHDRRAWEVGIVARTADGTETEHRWFVRRDDLDLGNADLMSLKVGRFHERHPRTWDDRCPVLSGSPGLAYKEADVLARVEEVTRGAHLVGAVVSFDADVLGQRMRANGICPSWHYHLIDVEALAVGYFSAHAAVLDRREPGELPGPERAAELRRLTSPPWKSDDLSGLLGISVSDEDRHTALGDAKWARALYNAVMGGAE